MKLSMLSVTLVTQATLLLQTKHEVLFSRQLQ
jgi:hypothetical protein